MGQSQTAAEGSEHEDGHGSGNHPGQGGEQGGEGGDNRPNDQQQKKDAKPPEKPRPRWPFVVAGVVVLGFLGVVLFIIFSPTPDVWTDDAYVTAHYSTVAPRITGQVSTVEVEDNQQVKAGQVLVTLDDRDERVALATAEAELEGARAQLEEASGSISRQPSLVHQQSTQVTSSTAQLNLAEANDRRYRNLASSGAGTLQQRQEAQSTLQQAQASAAGAAASEDAARKQIPILEAQRRAAEATVRSDEANVERAKLNLSYTRIMAPLDGMVGERTTQVGNYVAPGSAMMVVVPLDRAYVVANYREVALVHVLPGQHVRIHVDAYRLWLDGIVDSIPPASGAAFSPIEPNNATGNFTKIVQRLPLKILIAPNQSEARLLRLGLSVETTIDTGLANVKGDQREKPGRVTAR